MNVTRFASLSRCWRWLGVIAFPRRPLAATKCRDAPPPVAAPAHISAVPGNGEGDSHRGRRCRARRLSDLSRRQRRVDRDARGAGRRGTSHTSHRPRERHDVFLHSGRVYQGRQRPLSLAVSAMPMAPPRGVTAAAGERTRHAQRGNHRRAQPRTRSIASGQRARVYRADDGSDGAGVRRSRLDQRHAAFLSRARHDRRRRTANGRPRCPRCRCRLRRHQCRW